MRGALGGVVGIPVPPIGPLLFSWSSDGAYGTSWQDSAATIPAALGGRVGAIKSAQGTMLVNSDINTQPLLQGGARAGLPGLYFSRPRTDRLIWSSGGSFFTSLKAASALTVFCVTFIGAGSGTSRYTLYSFGTANESRYLYAQRTFSGTWTVARKGTTDNKITYAPSPAITDAHAFVHAFHGFSSLSKFYADDPTEDGSISNGSTDTSSAFTIGTLGCAAEEGTSIIFDHLNGFIYELHIFEKLPSAGDITSLFDYATTKWGLT